jgi:hypothetical protein
MAAHALAQDAVAEMACGIGGWGGREQQARDD